MAKRKPKADKPSAMDFLVGYMKSHPKCAYAEAQEAAAKAGFKIFPIMWGRAQVMLGRVKAKKRGAAKAAAKRPAQRAAKRVAKKVRRARKVPAKRASAGRGSMALPIEGAADLANWQDLLERINSGAKFHLQYNGADWLLVEA